jgi:hypothetical protein
MINPAKRKYMRLLGLGLLLESATAAMGHCLNMPDFLRGLLEGIGLAIMFIALFKMNRSSGPNL